MNNNATQIEVLLEKVEEYGKINMELFKLQTINTSAEVVSSMFMQLIIFFVVALFIFIINIGLSLWIGEMLSNIYLGFFIIGGFYGLLFIVLRIFRYRWLKMPFKNSIISQLLNKELE